MLSTAFDLPAIMRAAWASARAELARSERVRRDPAMPRFLRDAPPPTLRQAFARALRREWDFAKGARAIELWRIEAAAEDARREALPAREREVLALTEARALTPMIDSFPEMVAAEARIDRRLSDLRAAA